MSGVAVAIGGAALVGAYVSSSSSRRASNTAADAAQTQASSEQASLDYLKEREAIPQQFREGALTQLGGLYGLEGGLGDQQDLIDRAKESPLYGSIMGSQKAGEESILRNASATGGLRSGDTQYNLYDYNVRLQNQALLESYNQQLMGLQGMAGLPSNANAIAQGTSQVGQTLGQGQIASGQIQQVGSQQAWGNAMGMAQLGLSMYNTYGNSGTSTPREYESTQMYSDRKLKTNIKKIGTIKGFNFYSFDWNHIGNMLGLRGSTYGCMADEVIKTNPEAVSLNNGFMFINYTTIGVL